MVVLQRNEVSRNRILFFLTVILSVVVLITAFEISSSASALPSVLLGGVAVIAIFLSLLQLYTYPKRSQVLLFQNEEEIVVATNALHEGFKLRFLRDILGDNVTSFSDEDRIKWKALEKDGFYPALSVHHVRKLIMLRLCMMVFDDVFATDSSNRWEHHDSSSTAEPSFSKREMPRLTSWKSST
jgi:hypothetical protein